MQRLSFSLREICELIELRTDHREDCESGKRVLAAKRSAVRVKIAALRKLELELAADLAKCSRELKHRVRGSAEQRAECELRF